MKDKTVKNVSNDNVFKLEGRVPLQRAVPLGIQHVLAMFLGNLSPLLIVAGLIEMDPVLKSTLIQNSMFVAGIATLLQLYPILKVGSGLPIVMGTSSGFIGTARTVAQNSGYAALMGATLLGGIFEFILGFFIKPLKKLFPKVVTSLVVICIGLSLLPVGIKYFAGNAGGPGTPGFGSLKNLAVATTVLVVTIVFKQFGKGFISNASILIGIVVGYILSICLGMVDFTQVAEASWISLPKPFVTGFEFKADAIIAMMIMYVATTVETIGDASAVALGGLSREATNDELSGSIKADGLGSAFASLFGCMPNTSFSQNVGLVGVTKVVNRFTIMTGAVLLVILGFFPKLAAIFSVMPQSVLGGAAVIMFAMIMVSGIQSLLTVNLGGRNGVIVAVSIGIGVGIGNLPEVLAELPAFVSNIFAQNGIIMTFVLATVLNLVLPKDKEDVVA